MRLKLRCELTSGNLPAPLRALNEQVESDSFIHLARELSKQRQAVAGVDSSNPEVISHLASIDPRLTEDFLRSI